MFKVLFNLVKLVICYRYEEKDIKNVIIIFINLTLSTGLII